MSPISNKDGLSEVAGFNDFSSTSELLPLSDDELVPLSDVGNIGVGTEESECVTLDEDTRFMLSMEEEEIDDIFPRGRNIQSSL